MQDEINKIADWITSNKLSLHTAKTKFILFRSSNKKLKHNITISINEQPIKQVKNTTFLGVIIDEYLTWNDHIDLLTKKNYKIYRNNIQNSTFHKFKYSQTSLLCFSLPLFDIRKHI